MKIKCIFRISRVPAKCSHVNWYENGVRSYGCIACAGLALFLLFDLFLCDLNASSYNMNLAFAVHVVLCVLLSFVSIDLMAFVDLRTTLLRHWPPLQWSNKIQHVQKNDNNGPHHTTISLNNIFWQVRHKRHPFLIEMGGMREWCQAKLNPICYAMALANSEKEKIGNSYDR